MKVLHVINSLGVGGAEKLVVLLVPALREAGIHADLLILDRNRTIFHSQLESKGVNEIRSLGLSNFYSPIAFIKMCWEFRRIKRNYDVIHTHLFPTQYLTVLASVLTRSNLAMVTTEQNTTNRRRSISLFKFLDKHIYRRYGAITAVSPIATQYLTEYVDSPSIDIRTIANAVDIDSFSNIEPANIREELRIDEKCKLATQVSSFTPQKDHVTLVKAFAQTTDENFHLLLVGDGALKEDIERLTSDLKMQHRVHFLGIRNDIPSLLKASNIAVLSSHYEGLSLFVLEAFAAGLPVIGTDAPGLGEIIRQGGMVVPPKDVGKLADSLNSLSEDPALRRKFEVRGSKLVDEYSIKKIAHCYIGVYRSLLNREVSPIKTLS